MKTGKNPINFTFEVKGQLDMPIIKNDQGRPAYKSATLKYDRENDKYIGETILFNNTGTGTRIYKHEIPYASSISVESAQRQYLSFLNESKNRF